MTQKQSFFLSTVEEGRVLCVVCLPVNHGEAGRGIGSSQLVQDFDWLERFAAPAVSPISAFLWSLDSFFVILLNDASPLSPIIKHSLQ